MEAVSTTSSAASSVDGRSAGDGGYLNLGMFTNSGAMPSGNGTQQLQHQQNSDLIGGSSSSGGGYLLANGFGNLVGDSTGLGGGNSGSGTSFDLNDFPTLGGAGLGGGGTGSNGLNSSAISGGMSVGSGSGLAAALRQQQQILAQQQQQQQQLQQQQQQMIGNSSGVANGSKVGGSNLYRLAMTSSNTGNFSMANEDFPALSGGSGQSGGTGVGSLGSNSMLNSSSLLSGSAPNNASSLSRTSTNGDNMYIGGSNLDAATSQLDSGASLLSGGLLVGLRGLQQPQQLTQQQNSNTNTQQSNLRGAPSSSSIGTSSGTIGSAAGTLGGIGSSVGSATTGVGNVALATASTAGAAANGDYGLLGLLSVIRMTDADRSALALGSDLTLLVLNLATTEQIYGTFSSPFTDGVATKEPHYQLPMCYYMQAPALKTGHLSKFQVETLFYIFYALPKDVLQAYAAQELYSREWRYHGDLKVWFKRAGPSDGVIAQNASVSGNAPQYICFDINSWERRVFNGSMNQNFTNGFLSEDEIRVKL